MGVCSSASSEWGEWLKNPCLLQPRKRSLNSRSEPRCSLRPPSGQARNCLLLRTGSASARSQVSGVIGLQIPMLLHFFFAMLTGTSCVMKVCRPYWGSGPRESVPSNSIWWPCDFDGVTSASLNFQFLSSKIEVRVAATSYSYCEDYMRWNIWGETPELCMSCMSNAWINSWVCTV